MPDCPREAVDATGPGGLCPDHAPDVDDDLEDGPPADDPPEDADNRPQEGGSTQTERSNPTPGDDASGPSPAVATDTTQDRALAAFEAAIDWFHTQVDRDLPDDVAHDTPRDYYRDGRGWGDATIDAKRLGYAPEDTRDGLVAYLHRRGFDRETILATGLIGESDDGTLYALWSARYVLPYLDGDGRAVFAISRALDPPHPRDWAGKYDDDDDPAKYHKIPVSHDAVDVAEPIYGLDTVRDGEPVLITEGIADAITAHQAGYPCVSPVTTTFKDSDREQLVAALEDRDVPRVYLIQDAERPGSDVDDRDRLTLPQYGEGVKGAVATAEFLAEHGIDARIGALPRPGLGKVDLDDYLSRWDGDLRPILAAATPVADHPAHDPRAAALAAAERTRPDRDTTDADATPDAAAGEGAGSALFDLGIRDVAGLSRGYRGKSPLGHRGDSENYFVLLDDRGLAYDHKAKAAYNALTYLLVDAGERRIDAPNGRLDDAEVFAAWKHAKRAGHLPDDDPIPRRALRYVARDATAWDGDLAEHVTRDGDTFDGLPTDVYNAALDAVRADHGVDPGRSQARNPDAEPVAPLALAKLDALAAPDRERYARKRGFDIPATDDVRADLRDALFRELRAGNQTVVDAPTALGKSHTAATTPWRDHADVTGEAPVVHFHPTTDARDDAAAETRASSAAGAVLKGRKERCPVAAGDHDPAPDGEADPDHVVTIDGEPAREWFDRLCDGKGLPFSTAHAIARERNDQDRDALPCCEDGDCPAVTQWDGLPRDDDGHPTVDVIHATNQFAYVPSLRQGTNVILDEQPDFTTDLGQERIQGMITAYLRAIDAPVRTWEAFVSLARFDHGGGRSDAGKEQDAVDDALGTDPGRDWYVTDPDAHALAPDLARALWNALRWGDDDANGRRSGGVLHEPPRLDADAGDGYAGVWLSVVVDDTNTVQTVRSAPDLSQARAVVGLDAHPSMPRWELNTGGNLDMTRDAILDPTERALWRRYERGLTVVQVGDATRPRSGDTAREWMNDERVRTVLDRLRDHYGGDLATAISPVQVERAVREILDDVAEGDTVDEDSTMHYGEEKSRNDFADERVGYLYGCMDPGDGMVLDALAELNLEATPPRLSEEDVDKPGGHLCPTCGGDGCRECNGTGRKREKGRTFDGPDADTARALLASVRENHVAQAAGRYARNPDDPESRAVVYVHTDALPPGFADLQVPGVEWLATDTQRAIVDALAERPTATTRELADAVDCSKEHVRQTLARLRERGLIARRDAAGDHGADVYRDTGADHALADLGGDVTTNDALEGVNRWSLAVRDPSPPEDGPPGGPGDVATGTAPVDGGDPPPGPGD